jgi:diguanylate cyclase (GGDEF)-like protein/PAS domain S-box-containing protein
MNQLLDLLILGSLVLLFASIHRKRPTARVRFWLIGWIFVLAHFGAEMFHPASSAGQNLLDFVSLSSLAMCGVCFVLSECTARHSSCRWTTVALLVGGPWLAYFALFTSSGGEIMLQPLVASLGALGAFIVVARYYWRAKHVLLPLFIALLSCETWLLWGAAHHHPQTVLDAVLTECFLINAVLYGFSNRRFSAGAGTVTLSLYAWALVWPLAETLDIFAPGLSVNPEVWNLPKYFVAFGMILMLLEQEIQAAGEASEHYRLLFEANPHPMWMYDRDSLAFLRVNDAAVQHYGYSREELLKMTVLDIRPGEDYHQLVSELRTIRSTPLSGPWRHRRKDGELIQVDIASHLLRHEGRNVVFALMQDVTERQLLHEQLVHQANHDILTGLPNRALLEDRIRQALAQAGRSGHRAALLCLDVDRFKQINDTYGHTAGDTCLKEIARRLSSRVRAADTVARTGGEEFAILLGEVGSASDAQRVAADFLNALEIPVSIGSFEIQVAASIGIAIYPDDGTDAAVLWRDADTAMYRAKKSGGNQYLCVSHEISISAAQASDLELQIRRALKEGGLELHYQPQFTMAGHLCGLEALIRLHHPALGIVHPERFIPIAEESGLIIPLGNWVLDEVCRQSCRWREEGLHPLRIAFNVSPLQLTRFDFAREVMNVLSRREISPTLLEMEVTESTVMRHVGHAARQIDSLARMGVHFSVDDFGTGYSSLGHLHQLPVQTLKIDRSFVAKICDPDGTYSIVQAIIFLAHSLGMKVVAEGVEREDQFQILHQLECDRVQGFLFAPAMPADQIAALVRESGGNPRPFARPGPTARHPVQV